MRKAADAPGLEYGIEIEVAPSYANLRLAWFSGAFGEDDMGIMDSLTRLPRLSVGDPSEFNSVVTIVTNDLRSIVGVEALDTEIQVLF